MPLHRKIFLTAFSLAALLHVLPFWAASIYPLVDQPAHLAMARVYHDLEDPASGFHLWFLRRPELTPYVGYYWFLDTVGHVAGIENANRLYLTIFGLLFSVSAAGLCRAFGRSPWLAFLALPFAYPYVFYMGFVPYMMSVSLALAGITLVAFRMQRRLGGRWDAALVVIGILAFGTHPHGFLFMLCGAAVCIAFFPGPRARVAAAFLPSIALFVLWVMSLSTGTSGRWDPTWGSLPSRWTQLTRNNLSQFRDPFDLWIFDVFAGLWIVALIAGAVAIWRARRRGEPLGFAWRSEVALALIMAGGVGGYFLMPAYMMKGGIGHLFIHERFLPFAMVGLAVVVPLVPAKMPRWLAALAAAAAITNGAYLTWRFVSFDREMRGFRELAEKVEEGSCVAQAYPAIRSNTVRGYQVFNHASQYLTVWRGTFPCFPFAVSFQVPVAMKLPDGRIGQNEWEIRPHYPLVTYERDAHLIQTRQMLPTYGRFYRYFLIPRDFPLDDMFGAEDAKKVKSLGKGGPFQLVLNTAGTCGR